MNIKDKLSSNTLAITKASISHRSLKIYSLKISLERTLSIIMIQYFIYITIVDSLFRLYNLEILLCMKSRQ